MINDIRITSNELYGLNVPVGVNEEQGNGINFAEIMGASPKNQEEKQENQISFSSLGAPAGFFADISMLNEDDAREIGIISI